MEESPIATLGKRKSLEHANGLSQDGSEPAPVQSEPKRPSVSRSCVHEVAIPPGFECTQDVNMHGTIGDPFYKGSLAKTYPFTLDPFQEVSVACLERNESVLVSAHTSAGKTAVAEYAIAMAFRDHQRVIYTSPLKALSNQKYRELSQEFSDVGLMTGDVSIAPNASCIVMTTEILRGMLYRGSEVLKEVAWVIFDEIHYMRDRERGVVWEESIIFLPPAIKMVFLSATMSNATEFAEWICHLHKQPCHVVYTDFRPTPLQHYAFPVGGSGLYLVVDEKGQFKEDSYNKLVASFESNSVQEDGVASPGGRGTGRSGRGGRGGAKGRGGGGGGACANTGLDVYKIVKMIKERKFQPVIVFSFSRRECEQYAMSTCKLDFNTEDEKAVVYDVFMNAIQCLNEEDRDLAPIKSILPLLEKGIAMHHSGLLPIVKEVVEILFQEGLIKALFATETFAMGLNMPAKTVVFTAVRKWDGDSHRWMSSGEYIQMSGRAGRRGKDERGISIIMIDEQMDMNTCKELVLGKPAPLVSTFRLSYFTLLNLMSRAEGQFDAEYVIKHSFHQFQHDKALPDVEEKVSKLEKEAASLDAVGEDNIAEYHRLRLRIVQLEKEMMSEILRPERILVFLAPGRLVKVRDGADDWGWGVVVNVVKKQSGGQSTLPSSVLMSPRQGLYLVDTLLYCSTNTNQDGPRPRPKPCSKGEKGEMQVIPVQMSLICGVSALRVAIPQDLRPPEARQSVYMAIEELHKRFPEGLPKLDPVEDMNINDPGFLKIVKEIQSEEQKLFAHPLFKSDQEVDYYSLFQKRAQLTAEAQRLRMTMRDSQLHKFREELRNRSRVLKRLGHINVDGVVQLKGRAACLIDTADELLVTELMFNGLFNELDHHQLVALSSCFLPFEKSNEQVHLKLELAVPLRKMQETARMIAEVQRECKLEIDTEEYVQNFRPFLMDVFFSWSKVS
ncbi:hypothetical protein KP509_08G061100 [Ceratopteris richardii]|uniref:Uncharacterized protein n=1 Tax=Ceratopteris richardii TaxID=49495 RepID=A0A8T2UCY7_CERRI|nr:hypothetical protein KP509_08G061100 [Ceratopteris richardii]